MPNLILTKHINAPVERTFAVFTDFTHAADNIDAIKRLEIVTDGPIGKGTRFRETRIMFGREATEEMEIVSYQPNDHYSVRCDSCGVDYEFIYRFRPDPGSGGSGGGRAGGGGTMVEMEMRVKPRSFMAKLMSPMMKLMSGSMCRMIDKDHEQLKALAERGPE